MTEKRRPVRWECDAVLLPPSFPSLPHLLATREAQMRRGRRVGFSGCLQTIETQNNGGTCECDTLLVLLFCLFRVTPTHKGRGASVIPVFPELGGMEVRRGCGRCDRACFQVTDLSEEDDVCRCLRTRSTMTRHTL